MAEHGGQTQTTQQQQQQQQTSSSRRWLWRYKPYFFFVLFLLSIQLFLAYKSLDLADGVTINSDNSNNQHDYASHAHRNTRDVDDSSSSSSSSSNNKAPISGGLSIQQQQQQQPQMHTNLSAAQLGFAPACDIKAKEAISALQRAKTKDCRQHIAQVACAIQAGQFYAKELQSTCPMGNHTANALGCYRDTKEQRLLGSYLVNLKDNTPARCLQICLQSGFPFAGVQYGSECFCGATAPPSASKLADSSCNMKCTGNAKLICGGYYSMNIFETGIAMFSAKVAETSAAPDVERVRIAFLLTLNGRALRQVHRLIRAIYAPNHFIYIHVDARQDYLYRQLLKLETKFSNIRLARKRYSTIWGGASLLTMLLHCMDELLNKSNWQWDFVINLSESDFPVKTLDKLVEFLTANRGSNFVKSHGRETQRFIQKQGLDKTFVECDTHMWRIGDRKLPAGIQMDGGSDWVTLSRPFVEFLSKQLQQHELLRGLLTVYQYTLLPAESFFHTALRNTQFCDTYIDNNLHLTNWKRKQGCKCQYKHIVDWCGCSPNDFKPDDWTRLQSTEQKNLFFARKFESIINQAVLLQLEEWLYGPYTSEYANLHGYWQSLYHSEDVHSNADDLQRTIGESLLRLISRQMRVQPKELNELTHYLHRDVYKGVLLRFSAYKADTATHVELETRIRPIQYGKLAKNSKFSKRLRNLEIASDFDLKEQLARNFAKMLGPYSELVFSYTYLGVPKEAAGHSYNLTLLWIDPLGRLQDFNELHIEETQSDIINHSKTLLKQPLTPGIWTVKLIGRTSIYAQTKFLVTPLAYRQGQALSNASQALQVNGGVGISLPADFVLPAEWRTHLSNEAEVAQELQLQQERAQRFGDNLHALIDEFVAKFFLIREICAVNAAAVELSTNALASLPRCVDTSWSSLAPDPKSDVDALLKRS